MQLNSKGKLAKFYMWLPPEDKKLPQDLCTYFWGLIARAFFIFGMGGMILAGLISVIALGAMFLWAHVIQTLFVLGFVLFAILLIWLAERKTKIKIEILSEARTIIKSKVDAVKRRYCPQIKWE